MLTNSRRLTIEWQHCDPAGIVFYPRYFAMFDTSTTMLFEKALGMTKYQLLKKYDFLGYPMVDTRTRFMLPTRFGDEVEIRTTLIEVKNSSFTVQHHILKGGELAVRLRRLLGNAGKGGDRCEQAVEQTRAHGDDNNA